MSLYKNFGWMLLLSAPLTAGTASAEGDEVQQAYFPSCADANLQDDAFCLKEVKGKSGEVSFELKQKNEKTTGEYNEDGVWNSTGTELVDSKTSKNDIYKAFSSAKVNVFRGLKDCKDASVAPGQVCISSYDWARDDKGKKLKKEAKVPAKIGMVSDRDSDGKNRYHNLGKKDLMKYVTTPSASGGAGVRLTNNAKDLDVKIKLTADMFKPKDEEVIAPPIEEEKPVVQAETKAKDFECASSAVLNLNFPYDAKRDAEVQRFLGIQSKLTHARIHYAFLNEISKVNTKFDYTKIKQQLEDQIVGLMKDKNGRAFQRLNDAFEKAPLTNRTNRLLQDKKFDNLLQNQVELGNEKPQVAIGLSDLKFLTWASEAGDNSPSLEFASKVDSYIGKSDGTKNAEIDALKNKVNGQVADITGGMMKAKVGCQETVKCDALSPKADLAKGKGSLKSLSDAWDKQTLDNNGKLGTLRASDKAQQIKNYVSPAERLANAERLKKEKEELANKDPAKQLPQAPGLTEKKDAKPAAAQKTAAGSKITMGDVTLDNLYSKIQFANAGTTIQFGPNGCSVVINQRNSNETGTYSYTATLDDGKGSKRQVNLSSWPSESSDLGQFHSSCNPKKADKYTYHFSKIEGKQSGRFPASNSRFRALDEASVIDKKSGPETFWADEITGKLLGKIKEIAVYEAGKAPYAPGKEFWFKRCRVEFGFKGDGYQANNPSMRFIKISQFDKAFDDKSKSKVIAEGPVDFGSYVLNTQGYEDKLDHDGWYQGDIQRLSNYMEQVCR